MKIYSNVWTGRKILLYVFIKSGFIFSCIMQLVFVKKSLDTRNIFTFIISLQYGICTPAFYTDFVS